MSSDVQFSKAHPFCIKCLVTLVTITALGVWSFLHLGLNPFAFVLTLTQSSIAPFVSRFLTPELNHDFLLKIGAALLETLAISAVATLLAALISLTLALPIAGRLGPGVKYTSRFLCNFLRSVPELVWATIMVLAVGLGPFAGTLALAIHTTGVLGRLFGETLENYPESHTKALINTGSGKVAAFLYGTFPGIYPQLLSYTLYRWEMNIRMAAILGFVGAGGLGQMLFFELSLLREHRASSVIIAMLILVIAVDAISGQLRAKRAHSLG
jgi:phosphonate transport system permease protein